MSDQDDTLGDADWLESTFCEIAQRIDEINARAVTEGLPLRLVHTYHVMRTSNDADVILYGNHRAAYHPEWETWHHTRWTALYRIAVQNARGKPPDENDNARLQAAEVKTAERSRLPKNDTTPPEGMQGDSE